MFTDQLRGGGKERRMVELMKALTEKGEYSFVVVMINGKGKDDCAYRYIYDYDVKFYYLGELSLLQKTYKMKTIAQNEHLDLIHYWAPPIYAYMLFPIWTLHKVPIINSSITSARKQGGNKFWLVKLSYFMFDKILSNSQHALLVNKVPRRKAICIYNGFDPQRAIIKRTPEEVRSQYGIKTRYIVSMAAEYSFRKDWPMFVKAANKLVLEGIDVTFLAMGSGDASQYEILIEDDARCKDRIRFVGREKDVESVFNASDVVVLATCVEGVSNSIMEGMALGKPIVSTKGPYVGTAEIVNDGESGYLVDYHDYKAFAERIRELICNKELRCQMGNLSRKIIKERFGIEQMTDAFAEVYNMFQSPNN